MEDGKNIRRTSQYAFTINLIESLSRRRLAAVIQTFVARISNLMWRSMGSALRLNSVFLDEKVEVSALRYFEYTKA